MTRVNTDLIVLHTTRFGEKSLVLHTLSKEYGRRSFLVRSAGKLMSFFQPFNILEADITENPKSRLYTAKNIVAKTPLNGIRENLYKNAMTLFMSEVLYRVIKDGENEPGLFEWCERNIMLLNALEGDFNNFHLYFLIDLTVALGFRPEMADLAPFVGEHYDMVEKLLSLPFGETMLIPMNGTLRNAVAEELLRYIEYHTESSLKVNSLRVLHELFI